MATVNVPDTWPLPFGPGTMKLHTPVPVAKSPPGVEVNVQAPETAFELKPDPLTETTDPATPFPGDTESVGTTVN